MKNLVTGIRAAVAGVVVAATAAGCSTPRAAPVECGTGMRPINVPPAAAAMPAADRVSVRLEHGA